MNIQIATLSDADNIAQFQLQMAQETESLTLDLATVTEGVRQKIQNKDTGTYFVALDPAAGTVACILIQYEWSDWRNGQWIWLHSAYVKREHRGKGIFKQLLQFALEYFQANHKERLLGIRLYVEKDNVRAQKTYSNLGMNETHYLIYERKLS